MWSGLMNVSACRYGSPSFLSLPHFLYGDPALREKVHGLDPNPDLHSFYFAVEPVRVFYYLLTYDDALLTDFGHDGHSY